MWHCVSTVKLLILSECNQSAKQDMWLTSDPRSLGWVPHMPLTTTVCESEAWLDGIIQMSTVCTSSLSWWYAHWSTLPEPPVSKTYFNPFQLFDFWNSHFILGGRIRFEDPTNKTQSESSNSLISTHIMPRFSHHKQVLKGLDYFLLLSISNQATNNENSLTLTPTMISLLVAAFTLASSTNLDKDLSDIYDLQDSFTMMVFMMMILSCIDQQSHVLQRKRKREEDELMNTPLLWFRNKA